MGNTALCTLSPAELVSYEKETIFSVDEIKALWMHFKGISGDGSDVITRAQFQELMLFRDTIMLDRIFRVFDANEDQKISFSEYLQNWFYPHRISLCTPKQPIQRHRVSLPDGTREGI